MKRKLISIIGRPNVGKSTLFNRIIGQKKSIVSDIRGVTRDRVFGSFDWLGNMYDIIDTGGFIINEDDIINENMHLETIADPPYRPTPSPHSANSLAINRFEAAFRGIFPRL